MKKYLNFAFAYAILAMAGGVFCEAFVVDTLLPRPLAVTGQPQNVVGADMVMLAEFHQIGDGRRILARLVTGDLHLMVANGRR